MATEISSMFAIIHDTAITTGNTLTITNPGRAMQVVGVEFTGTGTSIISVGRGAVGAGTAIFATGAVADAALNGVARADMKTANVDVAITDEIRVIVNGVGGSITRVIIYCMGNPSATLTATTS
jgi:hypothetical protein